PLCEARVHRGHDRPVRGPRAGPVRSGLDAGAPVGGHGGGRPGMSGLWDWALAAYAAPGVADECLHLQDVHDQNVPLLLWAAWCAETGRRPDENAVEAACDTARVWAEQAAAPLRTLRRALKTRRPDMADEDREAVRAQVKA